MRQPYCWYGRIFFENCDANRLCTIAEATKSSDPRGGINIWRYCTYLRTMAEDGEEEGGLQRGIQGVGICLRVTFLVMLACAFCCTLASMANCNYITYEPREPPTSDVVDTRPDLLLNVSIVSIGLYQYDPDYDGCRKISDDFDQLAGQFTAAQIGVSLAAIFAAAALVLLLIDFLCCRFPCSRFEISLLCVLALVGQALTSLVFAAPIW